MSGLGQTIYEKGFIEGVQQTIKEALSPLITSGKVSESDVEEAILRASRELYQELLDKE